MGRGVLSGFFWGSVVSLVVVVTLSLLSPMPQVVASENRRAAAPVLRAPAVDRAPDMSATARDVPAPETSESDGTVASELSIPAGSEFRRGSAERAPAIPTTDQSPAAATLTPPETAERPDAPAPDTAPADAPQIASTGVGELSTPDTAQGPALNAATDGGAPLVAQPIEPRAPTRETVPTTDAGSAPVARNEPVTDVPTTPAQIPQLAAAVPPDSPQAVAGQAAEQVGGSVVTAEATAVTEAAAPQAEVTARAVEQQSRPAPRAQDQAAASQMVETSPAPVNPPEVVTQATADTLVPATASGATTPAPSSQASAAVAADTPAAAARPTAPDIMVMSDPDTGAPVSVDDRRRIVGEPVTVEVSTGPVDAQNGANRVEGLDLIVDPNEDQLPVQLPSVPQPERRAPAPDVAEPRLPQNAAPSDTDEENIQTAQVDVTETQPGPAARGSAPATVGPAQLPQITSPAPADGGQSAQANRPAVIAPDGNSTLPGVRRLPSIGDDEEQDAAETPDGDVDEADDAPQADTALARNANDFTNPDQLPLVSVILVNGPGPRIDPQVLGDLPFPMTVAINPTDPDAAAIVATYRQAGVEVLMLAQGLPTGATAQDVEVTLSAQLSSIPGIIGVMDVPDVGLGQDRDRAAQAVALLKEEGHGLVLYDQGLNSAKQEADRAELSSALVYRNLDGNGETPDAIARVLDRAAFKAARDGSVIMVGQNVAGTIEGVRKWATGLRARNFALAPASAVLTQP
ncbi:divergent polysaccharide deacetylase family protein [Actibacterium sp. 188UL27-1]|uniref:divergent polysaccharide deacetylase family protein n=1 Tax=Actibacterium sp. 188UL27-1 TaxID=2786961 RepID=UPI0019599FC3|nr:divergent polysaccharide deacetylase family protein [Actibacterium sp. 188UL27-1]MBM7067645.1 divergent polysaccharide deacetylase family protein [Actibacterium sp. 188UL27-1]